MFGRATQSIYFSRLCIEKCLNIRLRITNNPCLKWYYLQTQDTYVGVKLLVIPDLYIDSSPFHFEYTSGLFAGFLSTSFFIQEWLGKRLLSICNSDNYVTAEWTFYSLYV